MINLYTLPTCGICKMIKTKLQEKNISFEEKDFSIIADKINSDRAPALEIIKNGETIIYNKIGEMIFFINNYME